jgi:hypothetical protein
MKRYLLAASIAALVTCTAQASTNIAAGLPSSSYSESGTWAGLTAETLFNDSWWNAGTNGSQWVQVDLLGTASITGISYITQQLPNDNIWQKVYISDTPIGNNWGSLTPVVTYSGYTVNNSQIAFSFGAITGRYVQIVVNNGPTSWTALANAKVVGSVPEPATYAMLGAGLGLIGFAARRRRTSI